MDTKRRPLYMLSTRDPPQNKGHIQTESEGLEKRYFMQMKNKRKDSTHGHHQMVNTKIRLITFFAAKDGEAL